MTDIFRYADKSLMVIYRDMGREFQGMGTQLGFDELNVLQTRKAVNEMYKRMDEVIRREYIRIAGLAFREALREVKDEDEEFDAHNFVFAMLRAYDPLSDFVYTREYIRKRDRLFESIIATERGNQEMRKNLKRGLDVLARQVRQYADNVTIRARITAFRQAGIRYVRWITAHDDRVCAECNERHNVIYPIDDVIELIPAHWRCRCWLVPATEEEYMAS